MGLGKNWNAKRDAKAKAAIEEVKSSTNQDISGLKRGQQIRIGNKLDKIQMKNAKKDLKNYSKSVGNENKEDSLITKKVHQAANEDIRQTYSQTSHDKINRIGKLYKNLQSKIHQSKLRNTKIDNVKAQIEGYDSTADKVNQGLVHELNVEAEKGKHRKLKKKTDVNIKIDNDEQIINDAYKNYDSYNDIHKDNVGSLGKKFYQIEPHSGGDPSYPQPPRKRTIEPKQQNP